MNRTKIEWALNPDGSPGYTWNPITGCNNQIDGMCQGGNFPCYAYRLANGRLKNRYLANMNTATHNYDEDSYPFYPRFWLERMLDPRDSSRGKGIFVCDMSDLFGIGIPEDWTRRILREVRIAHDNRFYLLTKQPQNLIKWSPFPDNCFVGVSVTGGGYEAKAWLGLKYIEAKVKYVSFEPLLDRCNCEWLIDAGISWVIIGQQTKPNFYPEWSWVKEIIESCDKVGIPIFLKDNLGLPRLSVDGGTPFYKRHPSGTMELRQEFPK